MRKSGYGSIVGVWAAGSEYSPGLPVQPVHTHRIRAAIRAAASIQDRLLGGKAVSKIDLSVETRCKAAFVDEKIGTMRETLGGIGILMAPCRQEVVLDT